ncbi:Pentapeptide_repeats-containing protein [Hexamita inflata]|uniref:Pentapeptide_repeats-containing protein n=1 Tax=Hexamita inflata TaxID=28002 RepID=A0ABP1IBH8_9EUKA
MDQYVQSVKTESIPYLNGSITSTICFMYQYMFHVLIQILIQSKFLIQNQGCQKIQIYFNFNVIQIYSASSYSMELNSQQIIDKFEKLLQKLQTTLNSDNLTDQSYMDIIDELENLKLTQVNNITKPSKILDDMLTLVVNQMEGLDLSWKIKVVSVASQLVFKVYIHQVNDNITLMQETKEKILLNVNKIRNQIQANRNARNKLVFHLDVIETGINALQNDDGTTRSNIIETAKKIFKIAFSTVQGNYEEIATNSLELIKILKDNFQNQQRISWFQKILTLNQLNLTQSNINEQILEYIQEILSEQNEWHVTYAVLDILLQIFNFLGELNNHHQITTQISNILNVLNKLSKTTQEDKWHIREKIAEICLLHLNHQHTVIQQELQEIYLTMKLQETNQYVLQTLNSQEKFKNTKCWNKLQNQQQQKLNTITKEIQQVSQQLSQIPTNNQMNADLMNRLQQVQQNQIEHLQYLQLLQNKIGMQFTFVQENIIQHFFSNTVQIENIQEDINKLKEQNQTIIHIQQQITFRNNNKILNYQILQAQKRLDKINFYVPLQAIDLNDNNNQQLLDVETKVFNFIQDESKQVLLITGEEKTGKTTFCYYLAQLLLNNKQIDNKNILPIYMNLPEINLSQILSEFMKQFVLTHDDVCQFIQSREQFLLILDSYDQINCKSKEINIYKENNLELKNCKVITTISALFRLSQLHGLKIQQNIIKCIFAFQIQFYDNYEHNFHSILCK